MTTPEDVKKDFEEVNKIWSQANIFWEIKEIDEIEPNIKTLKKYLKWTEKNTLENKEVLQYHNDRWDSIALKYRHRNQNFALAPSAQPSNSIFFWQGSELRGRIWNVRIPIFEFFHYVLKI